MLFWVHCAARRMVLQILRLDVSLRLGESLDLELQARQRCWAGVSPRDYPFSERPNNIVEIAFNRFANVAGHWLETRASHGNVMRSMDQLGWAASTQRKLFR